MLDNLIKRKLLLIKVENNQLEISLLINKNSIYEARDLQTFNFKNLEIQNNIIFNHEVFIETIIKYVRKLSFKISKAILCIPSLNTINSAAIPFALLNFTIPIHKAGLKVIKITNDWSNDLKGMDLKELVDYKTIFYPPKNSNPYYWIFISLVFIFLLSGFLFYKTNSFFKERDKLNAGLESLNRDLIYNEKKIGILVNNKKELQQLEKINKTLNSNELIISSIKKVFEIFRSSLLDLIWLSNLKLSTTMNDNNSNKDDECKASLFLEGYSFDLSKVFYFQNMLSSNLLLDSVKIMELEMIEKSQNVNKISRMSGHSNYYSFKICSEIKMSKQLKI